MTVPCYPNPDGVIIQGETEIVAWPVVGYRTWRISMEGFLVPTSVIPGNWHPGAPAVCLRERFFGFFLNMVDPTGSRNHPGVASPDPNCHCGYWLLRTEEQVRRTIGVYQFTDWLPPYGGRGWAHGTCFGWGKIVEGDLGWRVQYARPKEILVHGDVNLARIEQRYSCVARRCFAKH